jgi:septal ring factor EnvC (AmiA/AmiB activator)
MTTLLAETAAPSFTAGQLYAVCGVLVFILSAVVLVRKVFGHEPPLHKEYVTKADHDKFRDETTQELKRHAARRAEIYEEQKKQGEKLARLETATAQQNSDLAAIKEQLADVNERVNAVPERTINLLLDAQKLTR